MDDEESAARRAARRRRGGAVLAVLGAAVILIGLVALTLTEPARPAAPFRDARTWAVSLLFSGLIFVAVGLFVRATRAPAPIARPRRSFLWAAGFLIVWSVGLALSDSDRDWRIFVWSGGLVVLYVGMYVHDRLLVRRRRAGEATGAPHGDAPADVIRGPDATTRKAPP